MKRFARQSIRVLTIRDRPLMTKLLLYSALLVVLPLLLVGLVTYRQATDALEREAKQYSLQILEQVKHYVEDYFRDFEINTLKILNHPDMVTFLRMRTSAGPVDKDIVTAARNVLKNSAYSRSDVTNITIILDDIEVIDSADIQNAATVREIRSEAWIHAVPKNGQPLIISRIIPWKGREEPVISIVKRIVNPNTLTPFGLLIIDVNYKRLQNVAQKVRPGNSGYMYIIDEQGNYVYHPRVSLIGRQADPAVLAAVHEASSGSLITGDHDKQLHTFSRSEVLGWQTVTSISYDELLNGTDYIGQTILYTTILFMIFAYLLGIGFVTNLVRPIKRLHLYMKRVEIGDFSGKVKVESKDEIGLLSHGFNKMVDQLAKLIQEVYFSKLKQAEMDLRQKETELRMLQAQINPHFLYNSLDTIRGMAMQRDADDISDMAAALARLLRYNVKEGLSKVTVEQEVDIVRTYLRIQKFRFEEKLEYRFDIPEPILGQKINKFTLQPIVENSIVHGLERQSNQICVTVAAKVGEDGAFTIMVNDTGPGIAAEKLEHLLTGLNGETDEDGRLEHIGIMNVHRRIRHTFGQAYGISITCGEESGTSVSIRLPYQPLELQS